MKKASKIIVSILVLTIVLLGSIENAQAYSTLNSTQHSHYISQTLTGSKSDIITNENVHAVGFIINKINNGNNQISNYQKIKMKFYSSSASVLWTKTNGFGADTFIGQYTNTISFTVKKGTWYEVATGITNNSTANFDFYYYGNDPSLDAWAYMQEEFN